MYSFSVLSIRRTSSTSLVFIAISIPFLKKIFFISSKSFSRDSSPSFLAFWALSHIRLIVHFSYTRCFTHWCRGARSVCLLLVFEMCCTPWRSWDFWEQALRHIRTCMSTYVAYEEFLLAHHGSCDVRCGKDRVVEASSSMSLLVGASDLVRWAGGRTHVWCLDPLEETEIVWCGV